MDPVEQIMQANGRVLDFAVVEPSAEEVLKYLMATQMAEAVVAAKKDITIVKQAELIHSLSSADPSRLEAPRVKADTEDEEANAEDE